MLPEYWIERPPLKLDAATRSAVDEFFSSGTIELGDAEPWKFLCGVAERRQFAYHGTGDPAIQTFEPRRPIDYAPFGDQEAVFATSDPIWAMFYAIVDRTRYQTTINNGCIIFEDGPPHYYFSVGCAALEKRPWRTGYVYLLRADTFVEQEAGPYAGGTARVPQLASPVPVQPLARLEVSPEDFPFLADIRGHDDERLAEYAQAVMAAAPWPK
jgi:hypothetical protein